MAVLNATLIGHLQPIFIIIFNASLIQADRLGRFDYLGITFMILAGLFVTTRTIDNLKLLRFGTTGDLLVLSATIAWATTALVARRYLRGLDPAIIAFYRFFFALIIFFPFLLLTNGITITNIYQILIGIVIGTILYYLGIKWIKAAQVSALELSTPFFATVFGTIILKEYITPFQGIGIGLLFGGIYFLSRS
ncbi:hypothetical protein DRP53_10490 [candidate division WOR-3 bacterium]|uniref:EamA domain-containing protein n=1 Tax=candidate division WOR-3 bacterium TaxID=2052148 RepID=A0A660SCJ7_UNCW3|nr:MAG: hypothetical protein DRP53_10490 [candidate division WOR-3 bacterium]